MRRNGLLALAVLAAVPTTGQATATAAKGPTLKATPQNVGVKAVQTVKGTNWPVIEFCSRTVRVSVISAQNAAPIHSMRVKDDGSFRFRYVPRNKNVGKGTWKLAARMRCESGKDGSPNPVVRAVTIKVL